MKRVLAFCKKQLFFWAIFVCSISSLYSKKYNYFVTPFGKNTEFYHINNDRDSLRFFGIIAMRNYNFPYFKYLQCSFNEQSKIHNLKHDVIDSFRDYYVANNALRVNNNFVMACVGLRNRAGQVNQQVFLKTNLEGDLVDYKVENSIGNNRSDYLKIFMNEDSSFIVNGFAFNTDTNRNYPMVYKLDKGGNQIKSKYIDYTSLNRDYSAAGMTEMHNRNFMVASNETRFNCDTNVSVYRVHLVEIDSNLNIVKHNIFDKTRVIIHDILEDGPNRFFIYGNYIDSIVCVQIAGAKSSPYIGLIDSNNKVIWEIKYKVHGFIGFDSDVTKVKKLSDGNYIATGSCPGPKVYDASWNSDVFPEQGLIIKFNNQGEILWSRRYYYLYNKSYDNDFKITDITELSNKQLVAVGYAILGAIPLKDTSGQRGWVLVMDSLGNLLQEDTALSLNNTIHSVEIISIYPNPIKDMLRIEFDSAPDALHTISIYNAMGQLCVVKKVEKRKNEIDLSQLSNGNYIVKVSNGQRVLAIQSIIKN